MPAQENDQKSREDQIDDNRNIVRRRVLVLLPLTLFAGLATLFLIRLFAGDPSLLPSPLIGHPAPQTALPPVAGLARDGTPLPGLDPAQFKGAVTVVNVWASWCVPCRDEAPLLMELSKDQRFRLVGINYKDEADERAALCRPLRQSVRRRRRRRERPRRHRMGRLWRAGDLRHRPRRQDRL